MTERASSQLGALSPPIGGWWRGWRSRRTLGRQAEPETPFISSGRADPPSKRLEAGWWVRLDGNQTDLKSLITDVPLDGLQVVEHEGKYYLRADDFQGLETVLP